MESVGVGFIGAGDVARIHKAGLLRVPTAKLVAVYDLDKRKSEQLAAGTNAKVCATADDLVSMPSVDVVYVLTQQDSHHGYVMRALRAGKHTFVEKPVSFSRSEIQEWIQLSREQCCICVPGHNYIHNDNLRLAKELIAEGRLGKIQSLWMLLMSGLPPNIRSKSPGPLREVMIHHVYSLLYLMGKPESVFATCSDLAGREPAQSDQAMFVCKMPGEALATLFASYSAEDLTCDPWALKYKIIGTEGSASHTWGLSRLVARPQPVWDLPAYWETFREEDRYFIDGCILQDKKPLSSIEDAVTCLDILEAGEKSIRTGAVQKL
jgi:predicted dehydrogenase